MAACISPARDLQGYVHPSLKVRRAAFLKLTTRSSACFLSRVDPLLTETLAVVFAFSGPGSGPAAVGRHPGGACGARAEVGGDAGGGPGRTPANATGAGRPDAPAEAGRGTVDGRDHRHDGQGEAAAHRRASPLTEAGLSELKSGEDGSASPSSDPARRFDHQPSICG